LVVIEGDLAAKEVEVEEEGLVVMVKLILSRSMTVWRRVGSGSGGGGVGGGGSSG